MLVIILLIFVLCLYKLFVNGTKKNSAISEPPNTKQQLPVIGLSHYVFYQTPVGIYDFLRKISIESLMNGGGVKFTAWTKKFYVLTDPRDCQIVGRTCLNKPIFYDLGKELVGDGILVSAEKKWKSHRKLFNPAFSPVILDGYMATFNNQARKLVEQLSKEVGKGPFNQLSYINISYLETVIHTVMGINFKQKEFMLEVVKQTEKSKILLGALIIKFWLHLPFIYKISATKIKIDKVSDEFSKITYKIIEQKKANLRINNIKKEESRNSKFKPFLDLILEMDGKILSNKELRDEIVIMMLAGYETVSSATTTILKLLGRHPEIRNRVNKELIEIFGDSERDVENGDLRQMLYLEAVIKESLRYYPTVPIAGRRVDEDIKLSKWTILAGTTCILSMYGLSRHPSWGPDVDQFRPERWFDQTLPEANLCFAPFGIGKRNCIGQSYAMNIMKVTLAHILRRYKVSADDEEVIFPFAKVISPESGHHISIEEWKSDYQLNVYNI